MHDTLNVNDRVRLELVDPADDLAVFFVKILRVRHTEFIDPDRQIDLAKISFGQKALEGAFCRLLSSGGIVHFFIFVKEIVDRRRFTGKEGGCVCHAAVFIQADCPGVSDKKGIDKIAVLYLLETVVGSVRCKQAFRVLIVDSILWREIGLLGNSIVFCLDNRCTGPGRHLLGLRVGFGCFLPLRTLIPVFFTAVRAVRICAGRLFFPCFFLSYIFFVYIFFVDVFFFCFFLLCFFSLIIVFCRLFFYCLFFTGLFVGLFL